MEYYNLINWYPFMLAMLRAAELERLSMNDLPIPELLGLALIVLAVLVALAWIFFPFMAINRMDKALMLLREISSQLDKLTDKTAGVRDELKKQSPPPPPPPPPVPARPIMATCKCNSCSGKIEFNEEGFDYRNPPTVACPHCGLDTLLYIPTTSPKV